MLAPFYVAKDDTAPGAASDGYAPGYVTNVAVPFLVSGAEKDELAMSRHIMWQKPLGKIVSKCFTRQSWAFIMAETRHDIRRMTQILLCVNMLLSAKKLLNKSVERNL